MDLFRLVLALLPFTIFCLLLFLNPKTSLLKISLITLLVTIVIVILFWGVTLPVIVFSGSRGLLVSLDILVIIFGAILFLEILTKNKVMANLAYHLSNYSPDLRIQVILLAWFLENFIEGIAGFGTPSIIVAPILVTLGLSPIKALVIGMFGNSVSVPFGAVGTPIRIGFSGIDLNPALMSTPAALYNCVGFLVPVFMLWVLVSSLANRKIMFIQALPFAIWCGLAFVVPSYLVSFFGYEFPSILGSIIGLVLVLLTSRAGFFVPSEVYRHPLPPVKPAHLLSPGLTAFPYVVFILSLILAKLFLNTVFFAIPFLDYSFSIFNPGVIFILTSLLFVFIYKVSPTDLGKTSSLALKKTLPPFLVVAVMSTIVQLMNYSGNDALNLLSVTQTISHIFKTNMLPLIAPFVGALGSFITGSATVSNLMFAPSLYTSSLFVGLDPVKILSLTLVGAGAGNMIALADVLAAKTVVSPGTSLRSLIILLLPYCLIYLVLVSLFGVFF